MEVKVVRALRVSKQGVRILVELLSEDGTEWKGFDLSAGSALTLEKVIHGLLQEMR